MDITNFDKIRCGTWPNSLDIRRIAGHESYGVMAIAQTFFLENETAYVQFRKHNESKEVALLTYKYDDFDPPNGWKNSTVIWDSRTK